MAEKTEQPTPKRLRDAREKGQVCKSQDVASASIIIFMFLYLGIAFPYMRRSIERLMLVAMDLIPNQDIQGAMDTLRTVGMDVFVWVGMAPVILAGVVGAVANLCQVGFLAAFESVMPKLDKLSPANWFKNVFSKKNLLEFVKGVVKMGLISFIFYSAVNKHLGEIAALPVAGFDAVISVAGYVLWDICKWMTGLFAAVAAVDYLLQYHMYMGEMMMSHEEIKQEYKEMEGDPIVKSQRKQLHQEMVFGDDEAKVERSNVVVTNPSHYAVALRYVKGQTQLPVVMAKGMDGGAVRIMRLAERKGIPIYRNVPLARALYGLGTEMEYIPSELVEPVAEVILWLHEEFPVLTREGGE